MTKVLVDLTYLRHVRVGGSETYVSAVVDGLVRSADELDLELYFLGAASALEAVGLADLPSDTKVTLPEPIKHAGFLWIIVDSFWGIPKTKRFDVDVVWSPGNFQSWTSRRPQVITVHDLMHRNKPKMLKRSARLTRPLQFPGSCRRASRVIVLSERVKADLVKEYPRQVAGGAKVQVIPPGTDHVAKAAGGRLPDKLVELGLGAGSYYTYPAMFAPHKNHDLLLRAYADARTRGVTRPLVFTGAHGSKEFHAKLDGLCADLGVHEHVHFVPGIDHHADVLAVIENARAVLFPSVHEGFALGVSEAVALGVPVVVATEVPAGMVFDPDVTRLPCDDPAAWTRAICDLEADLAPFTAKAANATATAAAYTWREAAAQTAAVFHAARRD